MTQTITASASRTYTTTDVQDVVRRFRADLAMIADSTGAISSADADQYADDVEVLATSKYLSAVDVTLMSGNVEICAARYDVNTDAAGIASSRPGGVLWPRVVAPFLRVVLSYTSAYTAEARAATKQRLKRGWVPTSADTSHSALNLSGGRSYTSNGYGLQRKDWTT